MTITAAVLLVAPNVSHTVMGLDTGLVIGALVLVVALGSIVIRSLVEQTPQMKYERVQSTDVAKNNEDTQ